MNIKKLRAVQVIALIVGALGTYVLLGWAMGVELMVRVVPHSVAMGLNTAVLFVAAAVALLRPVASRPRHSRQFSFLIFILIALPSAILFEHLSGVALGIDWASLHALVKDGNPFPGRTAPNTCVGFIFIGLAALGLSKKSLTKTQARATIFCAYAALALGISSIIGEVLHLEIIYQFAAFNRMAFATAFGISLLGFGLLQQIRARAYDAAAITVSADVRITKTAIIVLTVVVVATGLIGFFVMQKGFEKTMTANMLRSTKSNAVAFEFAINQSLLLSEIIAARPGIQSGLDYLKAHPKDTKTIAQLDEIGKSFMSFGLTGYQLFDANGKIVTQVGAMAFDKAVMAIPLMRRGQRAQLLWQDGYVLYSTSSVMREGQRVGYFVVEQRLTALTQTARAIAGETASTDLLICGRDHSDALCFPSKFYKANLRVPLYKDGKLHLAISHALFNEKGVLTVVDVRGVPVMAGYAPIGALGLGMVYKIDANELYFPVREQLNLFVGLLILLVVMGTLMLRAQVQPMAQRLLVEKKRVQAILNSSHEAFVEIDSAGLITDWSAEAERLFAWSRSEAIGQSVSELIIPAVFRERHRSGMQRFLKTGEGDAVGTRMELPALHRNGHEFFVEMSISAIEDEGRFTFTAFLHDISARREADLKLAESERRLAQLARFDTLTGLPNRLQLHERLEEATNKRNRLGLSLVVMFLDVDRFKQINDTYGHAAGDLVLTEFAKRLKNAIRTTDTVGRLAGDEFVVFMETSHGVEEATFVAQKIIDAMQGNWVVEEKILQVSTSIGIAYSCGEKLSADALLAVADGALYVAKGAGRNRFSIQTC